MNYALIENGVVVNLLWIYDNVDFPDAVPTLGLPVHIGDTYENGVFLRDGEEVRSPEAELAEALAVLGVKMDE